MNTTTARELNNIGGWSPPIIVRSFYDLSRDFTLWDVTVPVQGNSLVYDRIDNVAVCDDDVLTHDFTVIVKPNTCLEDVYLFVNACDVKYIIDVRLYVDSECVSVIGGFDVVSDNNDKHVLNLSFFGEKRLNFPTYLLSNDVSIRIGVSTLRNIDMCGFAQYRSVCFDEIKRLRECDNFVVKVCCKDDKVRMGCNYLMFIDGRLEKQF